MSSDYTYRPLSRYARRFERNAFIHDERGRPEDNPLVLNARYSLDPTADAVIAKLDREIRDEQIRAVQAAFDAPFTGTTYRRCSVCCYALVVGKTGGECPKQQDPLDGPYKKGGPPRYAHYRCMDQPPTKAREWLYDGLSVDEFLGKKGPRFICDKCGLEDYSDADPIRVYGPKLYHQYCWKFLNKQLKQLRELLSMPDEEQCQTEPIKEWDDPEFEVYAYGLIRASVCTTLTDHDEITERLKAYERHAWAMAKAALPTLGEAPIANWKVSSDPFITAPNPCPCSDDPKNRQHFLMEC